MPDTMTCPSIAGVTTTFTSTRPGPAGGLTRRPGWGWEQRLGLRQIVGPDGGLLLLLPLEGHHLVRDLKPIGLDLVIAEDRAHLELQQLLANTVGIEVVRALGSLRVDDAARVAGRRVVRRLVAELLLVGLVPLLISRIRQRRLPLRRAVDVLGVLLQRVIELGQIAADRHAVYLRVDVQLLHLTGKRHRIV